MSFFLLKKVSPFVRNTTEIVFIDLHLPVHVDRYDASVFLLILFTLLILSVLHSGTNA